MSVERGLFGIIQACNTIRCPVKFQMSTHMISVQGYDEAWAIVDAKPVLIPDYNPEEEEEDQMQFTRLVSVKDHEISSDQKYEINEQISQIAEHIRNTLASIYGTQGITLSLEFGIEDGTDAIFLLPESTVSTPENQAENKVFGGNEQSDDFDNFILEILKQRPPKGKCSFNSKTCTVPHFKCRVVDVVYSKSLKRYKQLKKDQLYRFVENRCLAINPNLDNMKIPCCMACMLKVIGDVKSAIGETESQLLKDSQTIGNTDTFKEKDYVRSLTPAEASIRDSKGKAGVGTTPSMYTSYCYSLNLRWSPYRWDSRQHVMSVPRPSTAKRCKTAPIKKSKEKWVRRLTQDTTKLGAAKYPIVRREMAKEVVHAEVPEPKPLPPRMSQKLARRSYNGKPPFDYSFIDTKKQRFFH